MILLEKANVKRSGAISMGMDGLNNTVIPGYATPEQYTKEITIANDGIVDQAAVYKYAQNCYDIIQELDRFGMAYHAGAGLANLECYQINPLIKDYNGPACAYVAGPFGGYTANNEGRRFIECDYWSGQMMQEFYNELQSGKGPVFLKLNHLAPETVTEIERVLHIVERPTRGRFHANRGTDYRQEMIEMHISEIGFCSGHSASGVYVDDNARTTVPGLYAAGDMASVPHNYMLGAFTNGAFAGEDAVDFVKEVDYADIDAEAIIKEQERVLAPTRREDGIPPNQIEYKTRRLVNDYLQPPKVTRKIQLGQKRFEEVRDDMANAVYARDSHELMRTLEAQSILDGADMAAAASLYRTESCWGLYHNRVEYPGKDENWFCHTILTKGADGKPTHAKKPIAPYIIEIEKHERDAYNKQRIATEGAE